MPVKTLYDFKISENLYKDIQSQATWRHHTLSEEMRLRLERTGDPTYGYNYPADLITKIHNASHRLYLDPNKKQYIFSFHMSNKMADTLTKINLPPDETPTDILNEQIVKRLAYTLVDPFYDKK